MRELTYLKSNHDVDIANFAAVSEVLNRKDAGAKPVN